jgi:hypothetical protein
VITKKKNNKLFQSKILIKKSKTQNKENKMLLTAFLFLFLIEMYSTNENTVKGEAKEFINQTRICGSQVKQYYFLKGERVNSVHLFIRSFNSYDKLDLNCITKRLISPFNITYFQLTLKPKRDLIHNNQLKLNALNTFRATFGIRIIGVKGFELNSNPFRNYTRMQWLSFSAIDFKLFYNNQLIKDPSRLGHYNITIFNMPSVGSLEFFEDIKYAKNVSPLLFKNIGNLYQMTFYELTDTFICTNTLSFDDSELKTINSNESVIKIEAILMVIYNYRLDNKLLNRYLFQDVKNLYLYGPIASIHPETFTIFKSIRSITINANNLRDFYRNHLSAFYVLNKGIYFDYENKSIIENIERFEQYQITITFFQQLNDKSLYKKINPDRPGTK